MIVIPAAGAAARMRGRDKLLEEIDGEPLLARQVARALETGALVLVPVSAAHPGRAAALKGLEQPRLSVVPVDGSEGMSVSLREAARFADAAGAEGLMILPADMPELETGDLETLIAAFDNAPDRVHRATSAEGRHGHPVILPKRLFRAVRKLRGDVGARGLIAGEELGLTALPGQRALTDLDTPEDWDAWHKARR